MGRPPCCDKSNVKRGNWTAEEDAKLLAYVSMHGTGNWTSVPKKAGLKRCGKSCRLRWTNYLRPDLKRENFIPQEEELIIKLHETFGSRWSLIAGQLPGRTDNDVKNYWNTKLRKKLFDIGIDPVTHKPFSQIFADYGKIGGLLNKSSRFGSLNRDLRDAFVPKSELVPTTQDPILDHSMSMIRTMPKMEPIQDIPLNDNNNSWGLLAQIHAIQLMSDQNQNQFQQPAYLFHEGSCSSSSVSSSNFSQITSPPQPQPPSPSPLQPLPSQQPSLNQNSSSSSFSWSEFLLDNEMLLPSDQQAEENVELSTFSSSGSSIQGQDEIKTNEDGDGHDVCYGAEEMGCVQACNESTMRSGSGEVTIAGSSSSSSISDNFIEGILDQDSEMSMWAFPNLFDEPSY